MITLIRPTVKKHNYQDLSKNVVAVEPPLWMLLRAQHLKKENHDVRVIDLEVSNIDISELESDRFEIFLWGTNPSAYIQQRASLDELKSRLQGEILVWNKIPEFDYSLEPAWEFVNLNDYQAHTWHCIDGSSRSPYGVFYTSFGCPFKCKFCCSRSYYNNIYYERKCSDIIRDIGVLVEEYGVSKVKVIDEMFFLKKKRVEELCDAIIEKRYDLDIWAYARIDTLSKNILSKIRKAGFKWLCLGIESGNEKIRKESHKGSFTNDDIRDVVKELKRNGIYIIGNFMFGFPEDNLNTMQETLDLAIELNCEHVNFYSMMPFPGSEIREYAIKKDWKLPGSWTGYAQYSYDCFPLRTNYLSNVEVLRFRDLAFQRYFTNPNYLSMIERTFGKEAVDKTRKITSIKIRRKICDNS